MNKFLSLILFSAFLLPADLFAICSSPGSSTGTGTLPGTCDGVALESTSSSGDVLEYALVAGNTYVFSLCGSSTSVSNDSQMDLWNADFSALLLDNDDAPNCPATQFLSEITYTPAVDETVNLALYKWYCGTLGGDNWTLSVSCTSDIGGVSACPTGYEEAQLEDFGSCTFPAGWTLSNDGPVGGNTDGSCDGSTVFSFECFAGFPFASGGGMAPGFSDCQAVAFGQAMLDNTTSGEACFTAPIVDASIYQSLELGFDWQLEDYTGNGAMRAQVYTGSMWQTVFSYGIDGSNTESLNVTSFINPDFQVRYCFDTEGIDPSAVWGMAIDNHRVCGELAPEIPTLGAWAMMIMVLLFTSIGMIVARKESYELA